MAWAEGSLSSSLGAWAGKTHANQKASQDEIRQHLAERLDWRFAERNDQTVAQALYAGQAVAGVHTPDEAGVLDGLFAFLKEAGAMAVWQSCPIDAIQRIFIPSQPWPRVSKRKERSRVAPQVC